MLIKLSSTDVLPVSIAEAREHCRGPENGDDDVLIQGFLLAAVEYVQKECSIVLSPRTFQLRLDEWPCCNVDCHSSASGRFIDVPAFPVRDIVSIEHVDEDGATQEIDAANWTWKRTPEGARIRFKSDYSFPDLTDEEDGAIQITFDAGFDDPEATGSGDDPELVAPGGVKVAVLMLCSHWYENREAVTVERTSPLAMSVERLLGHQKIYR